MWDENKATTVVMNDVVVARVFLSYSELGKMIKPALGAPERACLTQQFQVLGSTFAR